MLGLMWVSSDASIGHSKLPLAGSLPKLGRSEVFIVFSIAPVRLFRKCQFKRLFSRFLCDDVPRITALPVYLTKAMLVERMCLCAQETRTAEKQASADFQASLLHFSDIQVCEGFQYFGLFPHLCVGFLFLVPYPARASTSSSAPLSHRY